MFGIYVIIISRIEITSKLDFFFYLLSKIKKSENLLKNCYNIKNYFVFLIKKE